jgi:hypothetical protein
VSTHLRNLSGPFSLDRLKVALGWFRAASFKLLIYEASNACNCECRNGADNTADGTIGECKETLVVNRFVVALEEDIYFIN